MSAKARGPETSGRTAYFTPGLRLCAASVVVWAWSSLILAGYGSASSDARNTQATATAAMHRELATAGRAPYDITAPGAALVTVPPLGDAIERQIERSDPSRRPGEPTSAFASPAEQASPAYQTAALPATSMLVAPMNPGAGDGRLTSKGRTESGPVPATGLNVLGSVPIATSSRALRRLIGHALDPARDGLVCDGAGSQGNCDPYAQRGWRELIAETSTLSTPIRMARINAEVNARIAYVTDQVAHGVPDRWSAASETMARGSGDCEDFAILKMRLLSEAGVPAEDMFVVVVRSTRLSSEHAVLAVKHGGETYILDNLARVVKPARDVQHYSPIFSANARGLWLHAFPSRVEVAGIQH